MDTEPPLRFLTASLHVDYLKPTPLGVPLSLRGRVLEVKGRKVVVGIMVYANREAFTEGDAEPYAQGEVIAVQVPERYVLDLL